MRIIFLRHGDTPATKQGLIQGSANDWQLNAATTEGLYKVQASAFKIADMIKDVPADKVFVYSADQTRCISSTGVLASVLSVKHLLNTDNIVYDSRLNGRSYGNLEGLSESKVKTPSYLLLHPATSLSMAAATFGMQNYMRIEPKNAYRERIFDALSEIFMVHNNGEDVVIISGTSDMFKFLQKDSELHSICYFGNERPLFVEGKKVKPIKIETGEFKTFEVDKPYYNAETGRWVPVWETLATRDYISNGMNPQKGEN